MPAAVRDLVVEEISLVDEPANKGARVVLLKRDHKGAADMDQDLTETVTKTLAITGEESNQELARKRVIKRALDEGLTTVAKVAAEQSLEKIAKDLRAANPVLSPEAAFVRAMDLHPDLAEVAVNG